MQASRNSCVHTYSRIINMAGDSTNGNAGSSHSDDVDCPLFWDGLPKDFANNKHIAALASFLEDKVQEEYNTGSTSNDSIVNICERKKNAVGSKVSRNKSRYGRRTAPYHTDSSVRKAQWILCLRKI